MSALDEAIKLAPGEARYYSQRANCLMFMGKPKSAEADMAKAEQIDPKDSCLLRLKTAELTAEAREQKGEAQRKTLSEALDTISRAIAAHPDDYQNYCVRATLHILLKNREYAFADAIEAFRLNPYHYRVHLLLGKYYLDGKELQKAEAFYTQAVRNFPKIKSVVVERAKFYVLIDDLKAALADYTAAIDIDGEDAELHYARASIHLMRGDADKAVPDLDKAIELEPGNVGYRFDRARLYFDRSDLGKALPDLNAIVDLGQANDAVYFMIAVIYTSKGDKVRAIENFRKVLEVSKDEKLRAEALVRIKQLEEKGN